jgi:hypothetical protein
LQKLRIERILRIDSEEAAVNLLCKLEGSDDYGVAIITKPAFNEETFKAAIGGDLSKLLERSELFFKNNVYHKLNMRFSDESN